MEAKDVGWGSGVPEIHPEEGLQALSGVFARVILLEWKRQRPGYPEMYHEGQEGDTR